MGNKIRIADISGNRILKKPRPNQTDLTSSPSAELSVQTEFIPQTPVGGGSYEIISDTWDNWAAKAELNSLPLSSYIIISDAGNTDLGAVLMTNKFGNGFENNGFGYFYVADFQSNGSYSNISNFQAQYGVWHPDLESNPSFSAQTGAVTIWNCNHYVVVDPSYFNGTEPDSNTDAYSALSKSIGFGYLVENDSIVFDFPNNQILWRTDKRGNTINYNSIGSFQFGDDNIYNIIMTESSSEIYNYNNKGTITGQQSGQESYVYIINNFGNIFFNFNGNYQSIYAPNNSGDIEAHINGFSSGLEAYNNTGNITAYIYDLSYIIADYNSGDIYNRYYDSSSVAHQNNAGDINFCEFKNGFVGTISLNNSNSYLNCVFANGEYQNYYYDPSAGFNLPSDLSFDNCVLTNSESTFFDTIGITGTTEIDFNFEYNRAWCGILTISSPNASETINTIINTPNFSFTIIPANNLSLIINAEQIGTVPPTSSILATGLITSSVNLSGRTDSKLSDSINLISNGTYNKPIALTTLK